ncbi:4362_t:CDS:2, partial [Gigaspora rosea]
RSKVMKIIEYLRIKFIKNYYTNRPKKKGKLPVTPKDNKYIVVATDYMTKWPEARAIKNANAQEVADFIYKDIVCCHGCPQYLLSD